MKILQTKWNGNTYTARPSLMPFSKIQKFRKEMRVLKRSSDFETVEEHDEAIEDYFFDNVSLFVDMDSMRVNGEPLEGEPPFPVVLTFSSAAKVFLTQAPTLQTPPSNKD